jgi:L-asparagine permease
VFYGGGRLPEAIIVICQIQLYRWSKEGILERPSFRLFGVEPHRPRRDRARADRRLVRRAPAGPGDGPRTRRYTGSHPVVAETPLMDELIDKDARQAANLRKEEGD